jgi:hypothetical protein
MDLSLNPNGHQWRATNNTCFALTWCNPRPDPPHRELRLRSAAGVFLGSTGGFRELTGPELVLDIQPPHLIFTVCLSLLSSGQVVDSCNRATTIETPIPLLIDLLAVASLGGP